MSDIKYLFKEEKSAPNINDPAWSTNSSGPTSCGKIYYAYSKGTDKVGNARVNYIGSYSTVSCCNIENPYGCPKRYACISSSPTEFSLGYTDVHDGPNFTGQT